MAKGEMVRQSVSAVKTESFSGPIPPPDTLAKYEEKFPGFGERILAMAEREAAHRHELDKRNADIADADLHAARAETRRGQWMAFVLTALAFAAAVFCAIHNQPWVAGIIAGTTLVSVVSTIMNRAQKK